MPKSNSVSRHIHRAFAALRKPQPLLLTLSFFLLATLLGKVGAFSRVNSVVESPGGDWTFSAYPALGSAYESAPVRVVTVTVAATKNGPEISRVYVKNQSSKTISAVKLSWWLVNKQSPTTVLSQGQTKLVTLKQELTAKEIKVIAFSPIPLVSFAEISEPLAKADSLTGEFVVEVAAHEVLYTDKDTWKIASAYKNSNTPSLSFMKSSFSFPGHKVSGLEACAKQECEYFESGNPPSGGFRCKTTTNEIFCTNCSTSCSSTLCGSVPPQCPGDN